MHEYLFDVKLFASVRVKAVSEEAARCALRLDLDGCTLQVIDPKAFTVLEASMDGDADLMEIDGEPT